jgi:hypothetical protein
MRDKYQVDCITRDSALSLGFKESPHRKWPQEEVFLTAKCGVFLDLMWKREISDKTDLVYLTTIINK